MGRYLTLDEVSKRLQMSKSTIYKKVSSGELPALRPFGRSLRFRESDLEKLEKKWIKETGSGYGVSAA